jgi:hypothetical protein
MAGAHVSMHVEILTSSVVAVAVSVWSHASGRRDGGLVGLGVGLGLGCAVLALSTRTWPWDALLTPPLCAGVTHLVLAARLNRQIGILAVGLLISLSCGLELFARNGLPPPMMPAHAYSKSRFGATWQEHACRALYADLRAEALAARVPSVGVRASVLHVGDSMLEARRQGGRSGSAELCDRHDVGRRHINAGFAGTGPDFHLRLLQSWLPLIKPSAVFVWVYTGNDLADIDRPYACCGQGPLLRWSTAGAAPTSLCPQPNWKVPTRARLARSPPPWLLRSTARWSVAAQHISDLFVLAAGTLEPGMGPAQGDGFAQAAWDKHRQLTAQMRAEISRHGARTIFVLIPHRGALQNALTAGHPSTPTTYQRLHKQLLSTGSTVISTWPTLKSAYQRYGERLYVDREHLATAGHAAIAPLLLRQLSDP